MLNRYYDLKTVYGEDYKVIWDVLYPAAKLDLIYQRLLQKQFDFVHIARIMYALGITSNKCFSERSLLRSVRSPGWRNRNCLRKSAPQVSSAQDLSFGIKFATVLMVCFFVEHKLLFTLAYHLTELCKIVFQNSSRPPHEKD